MRDYKIYVHTAPNGKRYVGITRQKLNRRWRYGEGYKRCVRWKSRNTLPVKHYVDYVTPMWEYRPKFSKCYLDMNKKDVKIDVKSTILDISERFGLENFLLNQYNNGISDVVGLFASDEWRDKVICQIQEEEEMQ